MIKNLTKKCPWKNLLKNRSFHNVEKNTLQCLLSAFEYSIFIRFIPNHTICLHTILITYLCKIIDHFPHWNKLLTQKCETQINHLLHLEWLLLSYLHVKGYLRNYFKLHHGISGGYIILPKCQFKIRAIKSLHNGLYKAYLEDFLGETPKGLLKLWDISRLFRLWDT
jgi:hypothetical protein